MTVRKRTQAEISVSSEHPFSLCVKLSVKYKFLKLAPFFQIDKLPKLGIRYKCSARLKKCSAAIKHPSHLLHGG